MKNFLFVGILLMSCKPSAKNSVTKQDDPKKNVIVKSTSYPYSSTYVNVGTIAVDTTMKKP